MEESISRMAGSHHGVRLDPEDLIAAARRGGRTPAQRSTLYEVLEVYEGSGGGDAQGSDRRLSEV
jgi:FO synthase